MKQVKVSKHNLLVILEENREKHKKEFDEAKENYKNKLIIKLEEMLNAAKSEKPVPTCHGLPEPVSHLKDYDRAIKMLNMSIENDVILEQHEFDQFVNDEWQWKQHFNTVSALYKT